MERLLQTKALLEAAKAFAPTRNYYYHDHVCPAAGKSVRVELSDRLTDVKTMEIVNFGLCPECKTLFYHEDYESEKAL